MPALARVGAHSGSAAPVNGRVTAPAAADMLAEAIAYVRPRLLSGGAGERVRTLWAGVAAARGLAATDVIETEFLALARDTGLATQLGRHADSDLRHVIRWAMIGMNPFQ
jgi:hypothetical protein